MKASMKQSRAAVGLWCADPATSPIGGSLPRRDVVRLHPTASLHRH
jgi:hypothetical protein